MTQPDELFSTISDMEDDLRSVGCIARLLGSLVTADHLDPLALEPLADRLLEAHQALSQRWNAAFDLLADGDAVARAKLDDVVA